MNGIINHDLKCDINADGSMDFIIKMLAINGHQSLMMTSPGHIWFGTVYANNMVEAKHSEFVEFNSK